MVKESTELLNWKCPGHSPLGEGRTSYAGLFPSALSFFLPGLDSLFNNWKPLQLCCATQKQLTMGKNLLSTRNFIAFLHLILSSNSMKSGFIISILQVRGGTGRVAKCFPCSYPASTSKFQDVNPRSQTANCKTLSLRNLSFLPLASWLGGLSISHLEASGVFSHPSGHRS